MKQLNKTRIEIEIFEGIAPDFAKLHKYAFNMMYVLFLMKGQKMLSEDALVYYANDCGAAQWIGGFSVEEEFLLDFQFMDGEVDFILITAIAQTVNNEKQPVMKDIQFRIKLIDCDTSQQMTSHITSIIQPTSCCEILRIAKLSDRWGIFPPADQVYKTIDEIIAHRLPDRL